MAKKSLFRSYVAGITDRSEGEKYPTILRYFWPELITAFLLNAVLNIVDAAFVAHLKSTSMYAAHGYAAAFLHFIGKAAEGISVGTVVLCGQYNGLKRFADVGRSALSAFWTSVLVGGVLSLALWFGAYYIYVFYQVPESMISFGVPYLRLQSIKIFLVFIYFALIGFLRGIKNTRIPMAAFLVGGFFFIFFDYALVFGKLGFPQLELTGSAIASIIQYCIMIACVLGYIFLNKKMRHFGFSLVRGLDRLMARDVLRLSWPVMLDKAALAAEKIWLARLLAPMGIAASASFTVIVSMEQFAFVPAIAFAHVITFLVSNDWSRGNWLGIKNNIKKVLFLSTVMVFSILLLFSLFPEFFIRIFDPKNAFTAFAATVLPMISVLVFFDLLQLILAGALRGAANVRVVMFTRVLVGLCVFWPLSYYFSLINVTNTPIKFLLIYSTFYLANGVMSLVYVFWFRRDRWQQAADIHL